MAEPGSPLDPAASAAAAAPTAGMSSPAAAAPAPAAAEAAPSPAAGVTGGESLERAPTLLGSLEAPKEAAAPAAKEAAKPAEAKAGEGEKPPPVEGAPQPAEAKPPEPKPAEPPAAPAPPAPIDRAVYAALKMPEGFSAEPALMNELTDVLSKRAIALDGAQELLGLHAKAMEAFGKKIVEETTRNQFTVFNKMVGEWAKQAQGDSEFGGAGFETSRAAMARMRDKFASSARPDREPERYKREIREMDQGMALTGAGSAPWLLRFMHNVARAFDEAPYPSHAGRPPKNNGQAPKSRLSDHYLTKHT